MNKKQNGFTLVELLAVISILSLILVIIIPNIGNISKSSKETLKQNKINSILAMAETYGNDNINNYKDCSGIGGSNSTILNEKCTINISSLLENGYVTADYENGVKDPVTGTNLSLDILLCYNKKNITVTAYDKTEQQSLGCPDIDKDSNNNVVSLNLSSSSGTIYEDGDPIKTSIIATSGLGYNCTVGLAEGIDNTELASCKIENNELVITPISSVNHEKFDSSMLLSGKTFTVTLTGTKKDGENNIILTKQYDVTIYSTKFEVDNKYNWLKVNTTEELPVNATNVKEVTIATENKGILSGVYKNNILSIMATDNPGQELLTATENNGKKSISFSRNVYELEVENLPTKLITGEEKQVTVKIKYGGFPNGVNIYGTNGLNVNKNKLPPSTDTIRTEEITLTGITSGVGKLTIESPDTKEDGKPWVSKIYTIAVSSLELEEHEGIIYIGGDNKHIAITTDNNNISCSSKNTKVATCNITGNSLEIIPETESGNTTIEVSNELGGSDTYTVTTLKTSINLFDSKNIEINKDTAGNNHYYVCYSQNQTELPIYNIKGENIGDLSFEENELSNWYIGNMNITNQNLQYEMRFISTDDYNSFNEYDKTIYKTGQNTGRTSGKITESNGKQSFNVDTFINKIDFKEDSGDYSKELDVQNFFNDMTVGDEKSFIVETYATGGSGLENDGKIDVSFNTESRDSFIVTSETITHTTTEVNSFYRFRVTVEAVSTTNNSARLTIKGTLCGEKTIDAKVKGKTRFLTIKQGTYTNNLTTNSTEGLTCSGDTCTLSCKTTGNSNSCNVKLPTFTAKSRFTVGGYGIEKDTIQNVHSIGDSITLTSSNSGTITYYANSYELTKPSCSFNNYIQKSNANSIDLSCTDTGSGITSYNITSSNFTISSNKINITGVSEPTRINNGYKYTISLKTSTFDDFTISLNNDSVIDFFGNGNNYTSSSSNTAYEYTYKEVWKIGEINRDDITAVLYDNAYYMGSNAGTYTLKIYGTGNMVDFTSSYFSGGYWKYAPWYNTYRNSITNVVIDNAITNIGDYAFYQNSNLSTVTLGNSITKIGKNSFNYTNRLSSMNISDCINLTVIDEYAFANSNIETLSMPINLTSLGNYSFYNANIKNITFNEYSNLKVIGYHAFDSSAIETITVPKLTESIGDYAFNNSTNLKEIIFSDITSEKLTYLGEGAFQSCTSLTSLNLPSHITEIKANTFSESSLENVNIGNATSKINVSAFDNANNLQSITIDNPEEYKNYITIDGILYDYNMNTLIKCPSNYNKESINMPEDVTTIGDYAFTNTIDNMSSSTQITLNLSSNLNDMNLDTNFNVFQIKEYALNEENITFKVIDGAVYSSDEKTLFKVPILTAKNSFIVSLNTNVIGPYAFYKVMNIETVTIPSSVDEIGEYAFYTNNLNSGINNIYLNSYPSIKLGTAALDIYDIEINYNSSIKRYITVEQADLKHILLDTDYIDNKHIIIN